MTREDKKKMSLTARGHVPEHKKTCLYLYIYCCRLPGSVGLQIVPEFTSLSQLTVSSTQLTDDELLTDIASSCRNLERLTFVEDRITIVVQQQTGNDVSIVHRLVQLGR